MIGQVISCIGRLMVMAAVLGVSGAPAATTRPTWLGTVTYVTDGDTLWVRPQDDGAPRTVRIHGIDAPEICQHYGEAARAALMARVLGQRVQVRARRTDQYGRVVARITLQGQDVGGWMVTEGHAWSYRYRRDAGPYAAQESRARALGRGLFGSGSPERPRDFRKRHGSCH
jgi:micrococcal nuclease